MRCELQFEGCRMNRVFKWKDGLSTVVCTTADELLLRVHKYGTRRDFLGTRHSLLSQFILSLVPDHRLYTVRKVCMYTHILLRTDCI